MGTGQVVGAPEHAITTAVVRVEALASESFHMHLTLLENRFHVWRHVKSRRRA